MAFNHSASSRLKDESFLYHNLQIMEVDFSDCFSLE